MSFFIKNDTNVDFGYVNRILRTGTSQYDFLPDLYIRICKNDEKEKLPHASCSINGYCFYDSEKTDGNYVFSKRDISIVLCNQSSEAVVYCPNEMPSYRQNEVLRLISLAFLCLVIKNGGVYIRGAAVLQNNEYYLVCTGENDIIAAKCEIDLQKSDASADYCILKRNDKYVFYPLPWSKKNNNFKFGAYDFDSVLFIVSGRDDSKITLLDSGSAANLIIKNNYVRYINKNLYDTYISNAEKIANEIKAYRLLFDF